MPDKVDAKMIIITILTGVCLFLAGFGVSQMTLAGRVLAVEAKQGSYDMAQVRFSERLDKLIEQNTQVIVLNNTLLNKINSMEP